LKFGFYTIIRTLYRRGGSLLFSQVFYCFFLPSSMLKQVCLAKNYPKRQGKTILQRYGPTLARRFTRPTLLLF
jgi:hypothetical protein